MSTRARSTSSSTGGVGNQPNGKESKAAMDPSAGMMMMMNKNNTQESSAINDDDNKINNLPRTRKQPPRRAAAATKASWFAATTTGNNTKGETTPTTKGIVDGITERFRPLARLVSGGGGGDDNLRRSFFLTKKRKSNSCEPTTTTTTSGKAEQKTVPAAQPKQRPTGIVDDTRSAGNQKNSFVDYEADKKIPASMKEASSKQPMIMDRSILEKDNYDDDDDCSVVYCGQKRGDPHAAHEAYVKHRRKQEEEGMSNTIQGRSVLLVEKTIQLLRPHAKSGIELVGKDDAVFLGEQVFKLQEQFKKSSTPAQVTIGYHYTSEENLESIRRGGLLTIADRITTENANKRNRAYFGNGIYTGTNPYAFANYGNVGLLVAILKGKEVRVPKGSTIDTSYNTIIGNKTEFVPFYDEVILRQSDQVLPLAKFHVSRIADARFCDLLWSIHQQIQYLVIDLYFNRFNGSQQGVLQRVLPPASLPPGATSHALMKRLSTITVPIRKAKAKAKSKPTAVPVQPPPPKRSKSKNKATTSASIAALPSASVAAQPPGSTTTNQASGKQPTTSGVASAKTSPVSSAPTTRKRKAADTATSAASKRTNPTSKSGKQGTSADHPPLRRSARLKKAIKRDTNCKRMNPTSRSAKQGVSAVQPAEQVGPRRSTRLKKASKSFINHK